MQRQINSLKKKVNDQLELNSDSNAQQTELTTCINASLINCLEQKQITTITTDPISCSITNRTLYFQHQ